MEEYELDDFHHMYDEAYFEYQSLRHLEEIIVKVVIGRRYREMMFIFNSQYIISHHKQSDFLNEDSISEDEQYVSSLYYFDEVHTLPMIFSQDIFYFHFDYSYPIRIWLENSFKKRYPWHSLKCIIHCVNVISKYLMIPIIYYFILKF